MSLVKDLFIVAGITASIAVFGVVGLMWAMVPGEGETTTCSKGGTCVRLAELPSEPRSPIVVLGVFVEADGTSTMVDRLEMFGWRDFPYVAWSGEDVFWTRSPETQSVSRYRRSGRWARETIYDLPKGIDQKSTVELWCNAAADDPDFPPPSLWGPYESGIRRESALKIVEHCPRYDLD